MQLDGVALIRHGASYGLAFAKVKEERLTVADIGEMVIYSRVALPAYSFISSLKGVAESLNSLVSSEGRYDLLRYGSQYVEIVDWQHIERTQLQKKQQKLSRRLNMSCMS